MKRIRDSDTGWWIVAIALMIAGLVLYSVSKAETETEQAWVMCADYVNVREKPNKHSECIGRFETGFEITLDGKKKNGFLHCVNLTLEVTEGWIHEGYVVHDRPEEMNRTATVVSRGRLAARKYVNGRITRWLKAGGKVKVYFWSEEWAVTNCGYVKSQYLELEGE